MSTGAGKDYDEEAPSQTWEWASPEHKLAAGMLELAIADLKAGKNPNRASALAWIRKQGGKTDNPFSFEGVCSTLNLAQTAVRRRLLGGL